MHLQNIALSNFKNYRNLRLDFSPRVNCVVGPNGSGKTNLLDAVYYLCQTKSAFQYQENLNILHGEQTAVISGIMELEQETYRISCKLQQGSAKQFEVNGSCYDRLSEHIGRFPCVLIAPDDTEIIKRHSEARRRFLDSTMAPLDPDYLDLLIRYHRMLRQRNSLLKSTASPNLSLLEAYDTKLIPWSRQISKKRQAFIKEWAPVANEVIRGLTRQQDSLHLKVLSDGLSDNFENMYRQALHKDMKLERTTRGAHRDDLHIELNFTEARKFASQGQLKSVLIALKLAQVKALEKVKGYPPILLLDDIFDKLDDQRNKNLISLIQEQGFGQLFISDARPERTKKFFESYADSMKIVSIENASLASSP